MKKEKKMPGRDFNLQKDDSLIRVAAFEPRSLVNGPGARAVLWVQGCGRMCPGCFNPDFQKRDGGRLTEAEEVIRWVEAANARGIEGITFSGGEPFDQAGALAFVARHVQAMGLSVIVFTGYTWDELKDSMHRGTRALLDASDMLIAGPYNRDIPSNHPLLGSANQEIVFITGRYSKYHFDKARRSEFRISPDGTVRVTGFKEMNGDFQLSWEKNAWTLLIQ